MFRLLPMTLLLILSLASIVNAGLDVFGIPHAVITALYHFESTDPNGETSMDSSLFGNHISLWNGATLVENGKYDKCVQLEGQASFGTEVSPVPAFVDSEFAVTVWVKMPSQHNDTSFYFVFAGRNEANETVSGIGLIIMPSGNFRGLHQNAIEAVAEGIETDDQNVVDNEWHHIVFTKYMTTYALFLDGKEVASKFGVSNPKFIGDRAVLYVDDLSEDPLTGKVLIDDLGYLQRGLTPYDVQGLYNDGFDKFIDVMSVNPQGRLATTWGNLKSQ